MKKVEISDTKVISVSDKDYQSLKYIRDKCLNAEMCVECPFFNREVSSSCEFYAVPYKGMKFYPFEMKFLGERCE